MLPLTHLPERAKERGQRNRVDPNARKCGRTCVHSEKSQYLLALLCDTRQSDWHVPQVSTEGGRGREGGPLRVPGTYRPRFKTRMIVTEYVHRLSWPPAILPVEDSYEIISLMWSSSMKQLKPLKRYVPAQMLLDY